MQPQIIVITLKIHHTLFSPGHCNGFKNLPFEVTVHNTPIYTYSNIKYCDKNMTVMIYVF